MACERIRVRGQVQGVGFRPHVWRLARRLGLTGWVRNDAEGVLIEVLGTAGKVEEFVRLLDAEAPPLAQVAVVERSRVSPSKMHVGFGITASGEAGSKTGVLPDAAICPECREEIADPGARRAGYAFTNCTHCGSRFSIIEAMPYDRANTTMAAFEMCANCRAEYADPADRRFHAQPIACPECGPRVWLEEASGEEASVQDPLGVAAERLRGGEIAAVRGVGGFHLACDAASERAVCALRSRKRRPARPFALMAGELEHIAEHAELTAETKALLEGSDAPIVLLPKRGGRLAPSLAPGQTRLGWMLAYTPLHVELLRRFGGVLVMTSGNLSGEPQAIGLEEARGKLSGFCNFFVMHDRGVARRLDDSVVRPGLRGHQVLRRARGRAPTPLRLPTGLGSGLRVSAYGGQMKAAICLLRGGEAVLSHHLNDLETALSVEAFEDADRDYHALFEHRPDVIAADLHPDYVSTRHARRVAKRRGVPLVQVQHHHGHVAACMAGAGWKPEQGPVVGIVLDGLGLGPHGEIWGGEVLLADYRDFERRGHLRPVPLPGGTAAQIEPWRNLWAQVDTAGLAMPCVLEGRPIETLQRMVAAGLNTPATTSAGRLFDAVAAALGLCVSRQTFEGQAAMMVEAAAEAGSAEAAPYVFARDGCLIDPAPMWEMLLGDLARGLAVEVCAARFQTGLAAAFAEAALEVVRESGAKAVALSGGCFQNAGLELACADRLDGIEVLLHREVPANDGGLALGQAVVAAARS